MRSSLAVAAVVLATACGGAITLPGPDLETVPDGGKPVDPSPAPSGGCTTDSQCAEGQACAWVVNAPPPGDPVVDDCAADAPGTCVARLELECDAVVEETGCGCEGQAVTWTSGCTGLPEGYAPEPLAHGGACEEPVVDAGSPIAPVDPVDAGDGCAILKGADVQCGKPCGFPGVSCSPGGPGDPIGWSCRPEVDGGPPVWFCSEG